ncbi:hypothetical protein BJY16_007394 [Actinoplanes octamycinicus]|uniref:Uncharacterized protein n=1 Tax=Actinoplanes octamycinicus TaxID=135948 RepID=A0A7W7H4N4_9ACTN|nr:hypothetical protein [Actinoplanes octamycinicus]MBB4743935.1 hypothetical protein [Actinoplanes octamycinicus]
MTAALLGDFEHRQLAFDPGWHRTAQRGDEPVAGVQGCLDGNGDLRVG